MNCIEENLGDGMTMWLMRLMHRYTSVNFKGFMELGVHPGQVPVLEMVYTHRGISLRELAAMLHIKPPTVTVTVKRLERAGLICRRGDMMDMRISHIYLTEKGEKIREEISALGRENERLLMQGFSEEEQAEVVGYFRRMTENLERAGASCDMDKMCAPGAGCEMDERCTLNEGCATDGRS